MKKALTIDRKRQGYLLGLTQQPEKRYFCLLQLNSLRLLSSGILLFLLAIAPSLSYAYSSIANGTWNSPEIWLSINRKFSSKNIVEKISSRNIFVETKYFRNASDTQSGIDNNTT